MEDQEGVQRVCLNPLPVPNFFKSYEIEKFGLSETKLFHFYGTFRKNDKKSAKDTIHEPPFKKSWICA